MDDDDITAGVRLTEGDDEAGLCDPISDAERKAQRDALDRSMRRRDLEYAINRGAALGVDTSNLEKMLAALHAVGAPPVMPEDRAKRGAAVNAAAATMSRADSELLYRRTQEAITLDELRTAAEPLASMHELVRTHGRIVVQRLSSTQIDAVIAMLDILRTPR